MTMYVVSDGHFNIHSLYPGRENTGPHELVITQVPHRVAIQMLNEEGRVAGFDGIVFYLAPALLVELSRELPDVHIGVGQGPSPTLSPGHVFVIARRDMLPDRDERERGWLWYTVTCW